MTRDLGGLGIVALYCALWVPALIGVNVLAVVLGIASVAVTDGFATLDLAHIDPAQIMAPPVVAAMLYVQFAAMLALVPIVATLWRLIDARRSGRASPEQPWAARLGFGRSVRPAAWALSVVIGLTAGWFPGWVAATLREALPWLDLGGLAMIDGVIRDGTGVVALAIVVAVGLGAPIVEEVVFRGFLWDAFARSLSPAAVVVASSLLFAAYHMDPIHAFALLPTALALGWVRHVTGALGPAVVVHAVNNSLGVGAARLAVVLDVNTEAVDPPFVAVLVATGIAVGACVALGWVGRPPVSAVDAGHGA